MNIKKYGKLLNEWLRPSPVSAVPLTLQQAALLTERNRFTDLFTYRDFDTERNICYLDEGEKIAVGFMLGLNPVISAGLDTENQIEAVINACPEDTILQFSVLASTQIEGYLDSWTRARSENCTNPLLLQIAKRRRTFMLATATGPSMLPQARLHPRMTQHYLSVRIPYKGEMNDKVELDLFIKNILDLRSTIQGALTGASVSSEVLDEAQVKFMLRELLNPHIEAASRIDSAVSSLPMHKDLLDRNSRVTVETSGSIGFSAQSAPQPDVVMTPITVDALPRGLVLPMMAQTLGNPAAWDERITCPYFAYTTIHVLGADDAKDSLTAKLGLLNKQTMSESQWYRSMMSHLFERRDSANLLLEQTRNGHRLVRAYAGINIYTPPEEMRSQIEYVKGLWRKVGFRVSEEKFIALPVFIASMPMQYTPLMDPPNKGLQRASLMHSLNAAGLVPVQGDWRGTSPKQAGPLLVSRRGQLACFDLLQTTINYNFIIVAASGSGKSFLANEIVSDFLSKGGMARLIDVGRSYHRFCTVMGGENVVFSTENPVSLNPFSDIKSKEDLAEMMAMLKDLLRQMAFPLTPEEETPAWQYAALEEAIQGAWEGKQDRTELADVYNWLNDHGDPRAADLAFQLKSYAFGRYAPWFSGPRTVSFNNPLVVIELEELKSDPQLQAVVMTLVIHQVTKEMYLSDRKIPKLLAIDEAWDLLSGLRTGKFIETAFRRARKYNGIAGIITQSFEDFEKSAAAKAAIENAAWQFILYQRAESLDFAVRNKRLVSDEGTVNLIRSVRSGLGFSEIYVRGENGSGLYRFVTDKHSYYTFTTNPKDINRLNALVETGMSISEAIDKLAMADYSKMWGPDFAASQAAAN
jgi:conjugal transfer ATP-binding protein TraC